MDISNWIDFLENERGKISGTPTDKQKFISGLCSELNTLRSQLNFAATPLTFSRDLSVPSGAQSVSGGSGGAGGTGEASTLKRHEETIAEFSQRMQGDMQRRRDLLQKYNCPPATTQPPTKEVAGRAVRNSTPPEVSSRMLQAQSVVRKTFDEEHAQKYFDEMTLQFSPRTRDRIIERLQELKDSSKKRGKTSSPEDDKDDPAKRRRFDKDQGEGGGGGASGRP